MMLNSRAFYTDVKIITQFILVEAMRLFPKLRRSRVTALYGASPSPDIKANSSDRSVTPTDNLSVTVALNPGVALVTMLTCGLQ